MSTLKTTNLQHASASSANIILNSDGTVGGAALASASEIFGTRTTGSVTSGTTSLTVASATGISAGMFVVGEGITPGTTVSSIVSTTVTLSANANITLSSDPVTFYANNKLVSPGVIGGMLCRAWVNFNGTSTVDIRACYNVSSITDNGTGDYTVNFTTAMPDANYSAVAQCNDRSTVYGTPLVTRLGTQSASSSIVFCEDPFTSGPTKYDPTIMNVAIFR